MEAVASAPVAVDEESGPYRGSAIVNGASGRRDPRGNKGSWIARSTLPRRRASDARVFFSRRTARLISRDEVDGRGRGRRRRARRRRRLGEEGERRWAEGMNGSAMKSDRRFWLDLNQRPEGDSSDAEDSL
ncbi:uncharacterized protein A4U43_C05F32630 [Asparagus officinalis]|uniref:Uncharacterized protein n=1 Tax=Asparagus officinalis TaxID=4686 RepID=A0A5P1F0T7_ASPOF|nr:uncharacterized protein A4U43_C05F32630 [Asparagus officinalis]